MTEPHPGEAGNDDEERDGLGDPAASHGSDLDRRTGADDRPEPAGGSLSRRPRTDRWWPTGRPGPAGAR
jgi:hypothetical protein